MTTKPKKRATRPKRDVIGPLRYVVAVREADRGSPETFERYVSALAYQPYSNKEPYRALSNLGEAFVFTTLAAAEFAAVWVGGEVRKLS